VSDELRRLASTEPGPWVNAALRGAELAGLSFRGLDLSGADLRNADLRKTRLIGVNLSGADLTGADLTDAELDRVDATTADLSQLRGRGSVWRQCVLLGARLTSADLSRARFSGCQLEGVVLSGAALDDAALVGCCCDESDLRDASLARTETVDSTFRNSQLAGARAWLGSRELVVEALRRRVDTADVEAMSLLGAVVTMRKWCYAEWHEYLSSPDLLAYQTVAETILGEYPESGAAAALSVGLDWRR
jgi:hypothetical protein